LYIEDKYTRRIYINIL